MERDCTHLQMGAVRMVQDVLGLETRHSSSTWNRKNFISFIKGMELYLLRQSA
jgi:hypothetical protein